MGPSVSATWITLFPSQACRGTCRTLVTPSSMEDSSYSASGEKSSRIQPLSLDQLDTWEATLTIMNTISGETRSMVGESSILRLTNTTRPLTRTTTTGCGQAST